MVKNCLICRNHMIGALKEKPIDDFYAYHCPCCGIVNLAEDALERLSFADSFSEEEKAIISIYLRDQYEKNRGNHTENPVTLKNLKDIVETYQPLKSLDRVDHALLIIYQKTGSGNQMALIDTSVDYSLFHCISPYGLRTLLCFIQKEGLIKKESIKSEAAAAFHEEFLIKLTPEGFQRLTEISGSRQFICDMEAVSSEPVLGDETKGDGNDTGVDKAEKRYVFRKSALRAADELGMENQKILELADIEIENALAIAGNAESQKEKAIQNAEKIELARKKTEAAFLQAEVEKQKALKRAGQAEKEKERALHQKSLADKEREEALLEARKAGKEKEMAIEALEKAQTDLRNLYAQVDEIKAENENNMRKLAVLEAGVSIQEQSELEMALKRAEKAEADLNVSETEKQKAYEKIRVARIAEKNALISVETSEIEKERAVAALKIAETERDKAVRTAQEALAEKQIALEKAESLKIELHNNLAMSEKAEIEMNKALNKAADAEAARQKAEAAFKAIRSEMEKVLETAEIAEAKKKEAAEIAEKALTKLEKAEAAKAKTDRLIKTVVAEKEKILATLGKTKVDLEKARSIAEKALAAVKEAEMEKNSAKLEAEKALAKAMDAEYKKEKALSAIERLSL